MVPQSQRWRRHRAHDLGMNPVKIDPENMHGTPCFAGTRVPVVSLFDYLRHGRTVDYFLEQFPTVEREQVDALLDLVKSQYADAPRRAAG